MTAHNGRLEFQAIVVPTGGWDFTVDEGGGALTATIPAGTYSPTTIAAAFKTAADAAGALTYTVSIANGESGTGKMTVSATGNFDLDWVDADLEIAVGFDDAGTGASSYTGAGGMRGLWMPDCSLAGVYVAGDAGHWEGGPTQTVSPLGVVKTITRPTRVKVGPFRWSHVTIARTRQYSEASGVRSFERFIRDTMFGQVGYFTPGGKVRLYWNADASDYVEFWPKAPANTMTARAPGVESWAGLYDLSIEGWQA